MKKVISLCEVVRCVPFKTNSKLVLYYALFFFASNKTVHSARDVLRQMLDKSNEELVIKKGWLFVTLLKLRISSSEGGDFSSPFKSIGISDIAYHRELPYITEQRSPPVWSNLPTFVFFTVLTCPGHSKPVLDCFSLKKQDAHVHSSQ